MIWTKCDDLDLVIPIATFYSGFAWDDLTEISGPFGDDTEPPTVDEIALAELDLQPGQKFLYIFDFGDQLRHEIEVIDIIPVPAATRFPRIIQSHGEAPPQYREMDEDEEELDGDVDNDAMEMDNEA